MLSNYIFYFAVLLLPTYHILGQDISADADSDSKINGPLVTKTAESFIDTTLVLLQSLYYNSVHKFELEPKTEAITVQGVDLLIDYDGYMTLSDSTVRKVNTYSDGQLVQFLMSVPSILVNKTYSVRSVENPDSSSTGYAVLTAQGASLQIVLDITDVPYFVGTVYKMSAGGLDWTIYGEGTLLAEGIQRSIGNLLMTQYSNTDVSGFISDVRNKFNEIFNKNELILCLSCEYSYCDCFE